MILLKLKEYNWSIIRYMYNIHLYSSSESFLKHFIFGELGLLIVVCCLYTGGKNVAIFKFDMLLESISFKINSYIRKIRFLFLKSFNFIIIVL